MPFIGDSKKKKTSTGNPQVQKPAATASEGTSLKSAFAQNALQRAQEAAKTWNYGFKQDERGVVTRTQTDAQKASMLAKDLSTLTASQRSSLEKLVKQNSDYVDATSGNYGTDTAIFRYAEALKNPNQALTLASKYGFAPKDSNGNVNQEAIKAYNSLSVKDQLALDVSKAGNVSAPNSNDDTAGWDAWRKYKQALNQNDYWTKETGRQVEQSRETNAGRKATTGLESELDTLARSHNDEYTYDFATDADALAEQYADAGLSASKIKKLWADDYSTRYQGMSAEQIAEQDAQKRVTLQEKAQQAKAAIAEKYAPKDNTNAHDPSQNYAETQVRTPADWSRDASNNPSYTYGSQKAYDEYWAAKDKGVSTAGRDPSMNGRDGAEKTPIIEDALQRYKTINAPANGAIEQGVKRWAGAFGKPTLEKLIDNVTHEVNPTVADQAKADVVYNFYRTVVGESKSFLGAMSTVGNVTFEALKLYDKYILGYDTDNMTDAEIASKSPLIGVMSYEMADVSKTYTENTAPGSQYEKELMRANSHVETASDNAKLSASVLESVSDSFMRMAIASTLPTEAAATGYYMASGGGSTYNEYLNAGYSKEEAAAMGAWNALTEAVIERYTDKIMLSGGRTAKQLIEGTVGTNVVRTFTRAGAKIAANKFGAAVIRLGQSAVSESVEEFIEYYVGQLGEKVVLGDTQNPTTLQDGLQAAAMGAVCSVLLGGLGAVTDTSVQQKSEQVIADIIQNGKAPDIDTVMDIAQRTAEAATKNPLPISEINNAEAQGIVIDPTVKSNYESAVNEYVSANKAVTSAINTLRNMNDNGVPFSDPARVQAVKDYQKAVETRNAADKSRHESYQDVKKALADYSTQYDGYMQEQAATMSAENEKVYQYQFDQKLASDPEGVFDALSVQESALQGEVDKLNQSINGAPASAKTRESLRTIASLQENINQIHALQQQAVAVSAQKTQQAQASAVAMQEAPQNLENGTVTPQDVQSGISATSETQAVETPEIKPVEGATVEQAEPAPDVEEQSAPVVENKPEGIPDFSDRHVKYGKEAASAWIAERTAAGEDVSAVREYAAKRAEISPLAKERAFWSNVLKSDTNTAETVHAYIPSAGEVALNQGVHLLTGESVYTNTDTIAMRTEKTEAPATRKLESIKHDVQNIVGFTYSDEHYRGKMRRVGALGYYEPARNFLASDDTNSMTTFLHETGHAIGLQRYDVDEVNLFQQTIPSSWLNAYQGNTVQTTAEIRQEEASAEMFKAWMLNPTEMESTYPNTFKGMRSAIGGRRYNLLRKNGESVRAFMQSDTQSRIQADLSRTTTAKTPVRSILHDTFRKFVEGTVDSGYGLKKIDRKMERAGVKLENGSADARNSQARTASTAIEALYYNGIYDTKTGEKLNCALSETCKKIRTKQDMDTLNAYLECKQALDRYEVNNADWVFSADVCTAPQARAYVEGIEQGGKYANVVESANNIWNWLKTYRDTQLSDTFSDETKQLWETQNPHYIPQTREFTSQLHAAVTGKGSIAGERSGVNSRREGSTRTKVTPVEAIANMVAKTKCAAMKHDVLDALVEYYDSGDGTDIASSFLHEIDAKSVRKDVNKEVIKKAASDALGKSGMSDENLNSINSALDKFAEDTAVYSVEKPNGRVGNVIAVTQNGKARYFEVFDQNLLDAVTSMTPKTAGTVLPAVQKVTRKVNSLITSKNPAFALGNASRDFLEAYLTGTEQNPLKYTRDWTASLFQCLFKRNSEAIAKYNALGGSGGLSTMYADKSTMADLEAKMFGKAGETRSAFKIAAGKVSDAIEWFNGAIETAPRLAEYKRRLARGESPSEAIKGAKNCTTDFSTHGSMSGTDGALWRFFNASVQSTYKAVNMAVDGLNTKEGRTRLAKQGAALGTFFIARAIVEMLLQIGDDDGTYEALPDYVKESSWVIPTGQKGEYVTIPIPNGSLIQSVSNAGRTLGAVTMGVRNGDDVTDDFKNLGLSILNAISPFGEFNEGNPLGSNFTMNPLIQLASNTSWNGSQIVPAYMQDISPALQYNERTSWLAKKIGNYTNWSPMKVDYIISQNSGVYGELGDAITKGWNNKDDGAAAAVGTGAGEFMFSRFSKDTAYTQKITSEFYDNRESLATLIADVDNQMDATGLPYSPIFRNLNPNETYQAYNEAKAIKKKVDELSKQLSAISKQSTQYATDGDEEKARELRFKMQEIAAKASVEIDKFYDKWKNVK